MAYSSIAHMGYLILALLLKHGVGVFYLLTYSLATSLAFGCLMNLQSNGFEVNKI